MVTVGVASYNNALYLRETLESIRLQTYPRVELLIVDDASPDDSVTVAETWLAAHPEVNGRLIRHSTNLGVCRVCNDIVTQAKGEFICIIGSDDAYLPDKLREQVSILESVDFSYGVVYSDVLYIDELGNITGKTSIDKNHLVENAVDKLMVSNSIPAMGVLVRKSCYENVGIYDEDLVYEDADMWLRIAKEYKFVFSDYVSAKYRKHTYSTMYGRDNNVRYLESTILMLRKNLGFSNASDLVIKKYMADLAEKTYYAGGSKSTYWLKERWKSDKKMSSFVLLTMSRLKVPAKWVTKLQRLLGRR